jgi:hypothetical protein
MVAVEDANGARLAASNVVKPKAGSPVYVQLTLSSASASGSAAKETKSDPPPDKSK